jgi:hypothetical protein
MKKQQKILIITVSFLSLIIIGLIAYWFNYTNQPGKYDNFAKCLSDKGAVFYGAFWCPHCNAQKSLFGKSKEFLPYKECSNPDAKSQTQICIDQKIESYPTWKFADGSVLTGEQTFKTLSEKTGCALP